MKPETVPHTPASADRKTIASERIAKIDAALWQIHEVVMEATNGERGQMWAHFNHMKGQAVQIKEMLVR